MRAFRPRQKGLATQTGAYVNMYMYVHVHVYIIIMYTYIVVVLADVMQAS